MFFNYIFRIFVKLFNTYHLDCVDEYDNPVHKTKYEHPYSYDGFVTYRNGKNEEANITLYSDRLLQWDYNKTRELMKKHFGNSGDYYDNRSPKAIESFLAEYTNNPTLKLIFIMEYCNASNGYPVWRFDCKK